MKDGLDETGDIEEENRSISFILIQGNLLKSKLPFNIAYGL